MNTKIKCLVTGGAGFIGSHLCEKLVTTGYSVVCADNLVTGSRKNISHLLSSPDFRFIQWDITEDPDTRSVDSLEGLNRIYHLASPASPPKYRKYSVETLLVNSAGTHRMLELARKTGSKFLLSSTSEVYGDPLEHPQKETYFGNVNPVGVRSCYDEGKRFAEAITMEYFRKFKTDVKIIRIFNTYGPRMDPDDGRVISNFVTQALSGKPVSMYGDGSQTRSFCYVSDMVRGIFLMMENGNSSGQVINLGYPKEQTIKEISEIILKLTGSVSRVTNMDIPEDDPVRRKPDIGKAKSLLGWTPEIGLEDGLKKTIEYFKSL